MATKSIQNINILTDTSKILTIENLTKAIQNSVGDQGIDKEEARRMAEHMMNFFGYSDRIIDNILEPEDRDVFYMMEDSGILMSKDRIYELTNKKRSKEEKDDNEESTVYEEIPEEVWSRG